MTVSNLSNQLIVPITLWGSKSPTHCVSAIIMTEDFHTIITGCNDGQICIWDYSPDNDLLTPRSLLFGHSLAVLCLANGKQQGDIMHFVSSSESGEMSLWDLSDGRCIETVKHQNIHTNIQTYVMNNDEVRFFCNGYYSEILIIDGLTLETLFSLNSKLNPDWISAIHVLRSPKTQDDVIIGLSIAGIMKVWTLGGHEKRSLEPIYENESKPIRCVNATQLTCCVYNQRTLLIISTKYWQIYDVGDFAQLCSVENNRGERWQGGQFLSTDRVIIWNDMGKSFLYKLPVNCVPGNNEFHNLNTTNQPILYATLMVKNDKSRLLCPPAIAFYNLVTKLNDDNSNIPKMVLCGDSYGRVSIWKLNDYLDNSVQQNVPEIEPNVSYSLSTAWKELRDLPCGIIDTLLKKIDDHSISYKITASVYIPALGRLVCGREDGSIIIVSANQTIMLQLLLGRHLAYEDWPHHQVLCGHSGRVNTLLYPHHLEERYEAAHLVSGGVDFSVCLWDIFNGSLLHRFPVHAGEITQLFAPPKDCNPRVLNCVCSVASDHSVALLSLKERRCLMLASRHLFPITTIKWRASDDFLVVGCIDGSVYLWQMETGHLDRVLHGMAAEEVLNSCDGASMNTVGDRFVNPAVHLFRGLRHRNLAAIKQAAVRGLHNISEHLQKQRQDVIDASIRSRTNPLLIQGLRTNPKDQESHILFFDVEALIVQLLSEEYDLLSPNTMESTGLTSNIEYKRFSELACSTESNKLSGLLAKMKDTAESAAQKIQAKAESVGFKNVSGDISVGFYRRNSAASSASGGDGSDHSSRLDHPTKLNNLYSSDDHMPMEIARLLLSLLHAWGLDSDLDKVCESKLGLLRPLRPVCFGMISKGGHMSLLLPTYLNKLAEKSKANNVSTISKMPVTSQQRTNQSLVRTKSVKIASTLPVELQICEEMARQFTSRFHWELSTSITTNHLLSVISLTNTFMIMANASFSSSKFESNRRRLIRKLSRQNSSTAGSGNTPIKEPTVVENENDTKVRQQQIHDAWQLIGALHCVLLPDLIKSPHLKRSLVDLLARRWQDRCIEIRQAAQDLLLSELKSIGSKGRRLIVEEWSHYLPSYDDRLPDSHMSSNLVHNNITTNTTVTGSHNIQAHYNAHAAASPSTPLSDTYHHHMSNTNNNHQLNEYSDAEEGDDGADDDNDDGDDLQTPGHSGTIKFSTSGSEGRRRQATAIVLMGVIGSVYGSEIESNKTTTTATTSNRLDPNGLQPSQPVRRRSVIEGFGGGGNYNLARKTSKALSYLLLAPTSNSLPYHTSLRRAAIDLIGRGFVVWEPYLDVSKILLALLEFCCSTDTEQSMVPSLKFGLPLTPAADSARTARYALQMIAEARPAAFITTLAKEVTRYNTLQQQQQASLNIIPHQTVLYRSRPEILRNLELLINDHEKDVYDLIIETADIVLYSLDQNALRNKGLGEMFPALTRFQNVTYCLSSKRVAVGSRTGNLAIYELKTGKSQLIQAHNGLITCCAFSPDGKYLASYCCSENKISFWLTQAVGLFGLGNAQTKCVKSQSCPPMSEPVRSLGPLKSAKLVWVSSKLVILLFADGKEHRFCT
ncbi:WD repeat-containing protein Rbcn-3B isoform X2 [Dermatophagoides farinae]|uniref:WD repeat-containing protein Rbcn-3B isoform X2 n=1 Tax=Dermatophagoides farinae TaxID=6954 RepID=UPI003F6182BB